MTLNTGDPLANKLAQLPDDLPANVRKNVK